MTTTAPPPSQESVFWFFGFARNDHKESIHIQFTSSEWMQPPFGALGRDPFQKVRHGRCFPFAPTRRGNAPPVQGGGYLSERLRPSGLSLGDNERDRGR